MIKYYWQFTLLILSLSSLACQPVKEENQSSTLINGSTEQKDWVEQLNARSKAMAALYTDNAVKVLESGRVIEGAAAIADFYAKVSYQVDSLHGIKTIIANIDSSYEYEIAAFKTDDNRQFKKLIIWDRTSTKKKRTLEFVAEVGPVGIESAIEQQRVQWIDRCNAHDVKGLVRQVYSPEAIYYNHKPIIRGSEAIIQEYQYMNNENYQLTLRPIILEMVNEQCAIEIGQCVGSYKEKYILVWEKNKQNQWRILMDSNI